MRARVLICALLLFAVVGSGCAVDMSSKKAPQADKVVERICEAGDQFSPVLTVIAQRERGGESETALVLVRHSDGTYYVINMNAARAKKVSGIELPCK